MTLSHSCWAAWIWAFMQVWPDLHTFTLFPVVLYIQVYTAVTATNSINIIALQVFVLIKWQMIILLCHKTLVWHSDHRRHDVVTRNQCSCMFCLANQVFARTFPICGQWFTSLVSWKYKQGHNVLLLPLDIFFVVRGFIKINKTNTLLWAGHFVLLGFQSRVEALSCSATFHSVSSRVICCCVHYTL